MVALLHALMFVAGLQAGQGQAVLQGLITDRDGGVMPGVTVLLASPSLEAPRRATTDNRGTFRLAGLADGAYEFTASIAGFRTTRATVNLTALRRQALHLTMDVGALEEVVYVRMPSGPPSAPPPAAQGVRPIRVGGSIKAPKKLHHVDPVYPVEALATGAHGSITIDAVVGTDGRVKDARVVRAVYPDQALPESQGSVVVEATIGADGSVQDTRVVPATSPLEAAALAAVRQWVYTPTELNGRPIEVAMTVVISFGR